MDMVAGASLSMLSSKKAVPTIVRLRLGLKAYSKWLPSLRLAVPSHTLGQAGSAGGRKQACAGVSALRFKAFDTLGSLGQGCHAGAS